MIISECVDFGYKNEITSYLDKCLLNYHDLLNTYIYEEPFVNRWLIRIPGVTCGNILIEDGIIKEIKLYEDYPCFKDNTKEKINKFIGRKIDLKSLK